MQRFQIRQFYPYNIGGKMKQAQAPKRKVGRPEGRVKAAISLTLSIKRLERLAKQSEDQGKPISQIVEELLQQADKI